MELIKWTGRLTTENLENDEGKGIYFYLHKYVVSVKRTLYKELLVDIQLENNHTTKVR